MLNDVVISGKTYAKMNVLSTEKVDKIAVKVIKQDTPDFLIPFNVTEVNQESELVFEIKEGARLNYLPESMTKGEFVILMEKLINPFMICDDWFLDYHYLCLDKNYIMVGKNYADVKYMYIPVVSHANSEEDILNFFRDFIISINLKDDQAFVMNLYRYIKDSNITLTALYEYISKTETKEEYISSDVTLIGDMDEAVAGGRTLTLELEEDRGYPFPKFVEIDLGKGYATVGRYDKAGNPQSDYNFDATLSFISRRHFRIQCSGEQYHIIDLGSANGTMVNNEILVANMPYNVQSGDRIILSKNNRITYIVR